MFLSDTFRRKSFTLIELMIVVAIIVFLASIALPRYLRYFAKAKQAEVAVILSSLHLAEQSYWFEHGTYTTNLSGPNGIGWQPEGYNGGGDKASFYYTYGFYFPGAKEGVHYFTGKLKAPAQRLGTCFVDRAGFTACAAADIAGDGTYDVWSIDQGRQLVNI